MTRLTMWLNYLIARWDSAGARRGICWYCKRRVALINGTWYDWETDGEEYAGWFPVCEHGRPHMIAVESELTGD